MLLFHNDYNEMCHPIILKKICSVSSLQVVGYGEDEFCRSSADLIRKKCQNENLAVHFLCGGTQANLVVICASLRPHQAVIAASSAHINVHETGAIEATGHKVIAIPSEDGKITAGQIEQTIIDHRSDSSFEHLAQPKLVYISNSTELGTIYSLCELRAISDVCRKYGLLLFVDGARLGYALAARDNDVTLSDLAMLTDAFYIGGTKVGAMFGEAVVISNPSIAEDFRYIIKQRGGMLAKGWLLGLQFATLFEDDLYMKISSHANALADNIRATLRDLGYSFAVPGSTNQIFVKLPCVVLERLKDDFQFSFWEKVDEDHSVVRICTSWATTQEQVDSLCEALKNNSY